nr:MAG TPA: hypothetical protein [Caudoviricetes sp.]DAT06988.1 MAG TPA: hypothetical protein [Caudoviricetes sp.]
METIRLSFQKLKWFLKNNAIILQVLLKFFNNQLVRCV